MTHYKIYSNVKMPFPKTNNSVHVLNWKKQPWFDADDIATNLKFDNESKMLKLAVPHILTIMNKKFVDLKGYWRIILFSDKKRFNSFRNQLVAMDIDQLTKDTIKPYLELVQKSDKDEEK